MLDLYKILNLDFNSPYRKVYKRFIELSKIYHPDFKKPLDRENFLNINIAYYILEYKEFKMRYNNLYRRRILGESIDINEKSADALLSMWIEDATQKTDEYLRMPYEQFYKRIRKPDMIFDYLLDLRSIR